MRDGRGPGHGRRIAGIRYTASLTMLAPFIAAWMAAILPVAYVPELVLRLPRLSKQAAGWARRAAAAWRPLARFGTTAG